MEMRNNRFKCYNRKNLKPKQPASLGEKSLGMKYRN